MMQRESIQQMEALNQSGELEGGKKGHYGFKGRMFPLLGCIIGLGSILWTYQKALAEGHVDKFPWTDITHTAIHFPEYIIFRIGMMVCPVLLAITFQILKYQCKPLRNYLQITSFELTGEQEASVNQFGVLSVLSCLALCVSTATISDGKDDMNWTLHTIGATSFFLIALYMIRIASSVYRKLWMVKHFVPKWSYFIKKYTDFFLAAFILLTLLDAIKIISIGSFVEWAAAFFMMYYFFTLYVDLKDIDMMLIRK